MSSWKRIVAAGDECETDSGEETSRQIALLAFKSSKTYEAMKSALVHAAREGHSAPCMMLSVEPHEALSSKISSRIKGLAPFASKTARPIATPGDPRYGRYSDQEDFLLPSPRDPIYFIGHWKLLTASMMRQAKRANIQYLWVQVALSGFRFRLDIFGAMLISSARSIA